MPLSTTTAQASGLSRRDFVKVCSAAAAAVGLPAWAGEKMAEKVAKGQKPSVVWLHFQECTGCTESLLRTGHPGLGELILDLVSVDYHETLFAAAGKQIEGALEKAKRAGGYVLVVEGAIPKKEGGIYCMVGGKKAVDSLVECAEKAAAIICIGSCASWGGVPSAAPNPTEAVGVPQILKEKGDRQADRDAPGLPGEPVQPPRHGAPVRDLRHAAEARREGPAALRLRPRDPRGLPAAAALRRRPLRAGLRRRRPPQRPLPLQARLQGTADPRQLLAPPLLRGARCVADRHRPPLRRLHGAGRRLQRPHSPEPADRQAHGADGVPGHERAAGRGRSDRGGRRGARDRRGRRGRVRRLEEAVEGRGAVAPPGARTS